MDDEGYFHFYDRSKDLIKFKGHSVFAKDVEDVLYGHPQIKAAGVVGVADPAVGQRIKAIVVLQSDARGKVSEDEVKAFCRERLADYKVPHVVEFRGELPKTDVGKVSRREFREETAVNRRLFPVRASASIGMRLVDPETLRVAAAEPLQPHEHVLILDTFGNAWRTSALRRRAGWRSSSLRATSLVRSLARDAAVDLDELHAELLDRHEGYRAPAEAVDQHPAADGAIGGRELRGGAEPQQRIALVDLEQQPLGRHLVRSELRGDEARKLRVLERLAVQVDGETRDARTCARRCMVWRTTQRSSCGIMR